jgi:hypothetical protein
MVERFTLPSLPRSRSTRREAPAPKIGAANAPAAKPAPNAEAAHKKSLLSKFANVSKSSSSRKKHVRFTKWATVHTPEYAVWSTMCPKKNAALVRGHIWQRENQEEKQAILAQRQARPGSADNDAEEGFSEESSRVTSGEPDETSSPNLALKRQEFARLEAGLMGLEAKRQASKKAQTLVHSEPGSADNDAARESSEETNETSSHDRALKRQQFARLEAGLMSLEAERQASKTLVRQYCQPRRNKVGEARVQADEGWLNRITDRVEHRLQSEYAEDYAKAQAQAQETKEKKA